MCNLHNFPSSSIDLLISRESADEKLVLTIVLKSLENNDNNSRHAFLKNQEVFHFTHGLLGYTVAVSMCLKFSSKDIGIHLMTGCLNWRLKKH